jgi:hypothetical protein
VLNQSGQATSLPSTDGTGVGTDNWEQEESLDVEYIHAVAPGAQIVLIETNSGSLSDLMAGVATANIVPGVSVVSMSWGYAEGLYIHQTGESKYDPTFTQPGVTYVASSGDASGASPLYPAFSPNVLAVGGTSLTLNADNSYNGETGWGYYDSSMGTFIGSGGGISQYEAEPAYQQGVQSLGTRTTPDVAAVADPATGAWVADTYNLPSANPYEVVGGTSLSAPIWAGLLALANQGRVAAGQPTLNSSSPTDTQQALYMLPQADYHSITSGYNGYNANAGYNLVTGLGTPVANLLVPDLVAYHGPSTSYAGSTVTPLVDASFTDPGATGTGGSAAIGASSSLAGTGHGLVVAQAPASGAFASPVVAPSLTPGTAGWSVSTQAVGASTSSATGGLIISVGTSVASMPVSATMPATTSGPVSSPVGQGALLGSATSPVQIMASLTPRPASSSQPGATTDRLSVALRTGPGRPVGIPQIQSAPIATSSRAGLVTDSVLDELVADSILSRGPSPISDDGAPAESQPVVPEAPASGAPGLGEESSADTEGGSSRMGRLAAAVGFFGFGAGLLAARNTKRRGSSAKKGPSSPQA